MDFLAGGGEMAQLYPVERLVYGHPLGPIESWPQSLRTTVSLCLASNFPICNIIWGPQHTQIYNDGYRVVCGEGHPAFLGMDYSVSWKSAWPAVGEPFARALAGETSFLENQRMFLHRNGYLEETFFTFSLSPIRDETGGIGGLFHPVTETTVSMLGERRTRAVRDLTARLGEAKTSGGQVYSLAAETLACGFALDLPFALFYRLGSRVAHRAIAWRPKPACKTAGTPASPEVLEATASTPWPVATLIHSQSPIARNQRPGAPARLPRSAALTRSRLTWPSRRRSTTCRGPTIPVAIMIASASPVCRSTTYAAFTT